MCHCQHAASIRRRVLPAAAAGDGLEAAAAATVVPLPPKPLAFVPPVHGRPQRTFQPRQQPPSLPPPLPHAPLPPPDALPNADVAAAAAWPTVVALSALAALICSVDRAAISVAILPMSLQFGWTDSTKGAINAAFYVGYTVTNLLGGYLASTMSAKKVLGSGVVLWSLFTMATPAAAAAGPLPLLLANRAAMGAGEGVTFPSVQSLVKGWVPPDARSRALALIYSGGQLGTILALVTAPSIISAWGWPAVFQVYGGAGLVWMMAWQPLVRDFAPLSALQLQQLHAAPPQALAQQQLPAAGAAAADTKSLVAPPRLGSDGGGASRALTGGSEGSAPAVAGPGAAAPATGRMPSIAQLPWRTWLGNPAFRAILIAHAAFGVGHYVCLSWLPSYYCQQFGLDIGESALLSVLPWFVTVLVSNASGWAADSLANSGTLSMTQTRKLLQAVGSLGPAACLLYLAAVSTAVPVAGAAAIAGDAPGVDVAAAAALLTATLSLGGFQSAGFAANHQDVSERYAAVLFGITNATSSLMGTCSVYATGLILDATGSWSLVFGGVAGCYILGAAFYLAWGSAEQQFE